jgi:chaperone required for assembly of F1-ATPase
MLPEEAVDSVHIVGHAITAETPYHSSGARLRSRKQHVSYLLTAGWWALQTVSISQHRMPLDDQHSTIEEENN